MAILKDTKILGDLNVSGEIELKTSLNISSGGTGGTTEAEARNNLKVSQSIFTINDIVNEPTTNWYPLHLKRYSNNGISSFSIFQNEARNSNHPFNWNGLNVLGISARGWGDVLLKSVYYYSRYIDCDEITIGNIYAGNREGVEIVIYLRGGQKFVLLNNFNIAGVELYKTDFINSTSVFPVLINPAYEPIGTNIPIGLENVYIRAYTHHINLTEL